MTSADRHPHIKLRGVRVHNLQNIDLDLPLGQLIVVTGVSGSGKSSLAFDTLYAEGQRRYVESFSTYSRRFLERFEKPAADRIDSIPPAVAVRQKAGGRSRRATVGTATEIYDSLRLLFARVGVIECPRCRRRVERHTPRSAQTVLARLAPATRFIVCFPIDSAAPGTPADSPPRVQRARPGRERNKAPGRAGTPATFARDSRTLLSDLTEAGFTRLIIGGRTLPVTEAGKLLPAARNPMVVVDRLTAGSTTGARLSDSLELAFRHGEGACVALIPHLGAGVSPAKPAEIAGPQAGTGTTSSGPDKSDADRLTVDGVEYDVWSFNSRLNCPGCRNEFVAPEPALFNFNSPLGACPNCRGIGEIAASPADIQSPQVCPTCRGARLRPEALAVHFAGRTIIELTRLTVAGLLAFIRETGEKGTDSELFPTATERSDPGEAPVPFLPGGFGTGAANISQRQGLSELILAQAARRLEFLIDVGLGYLTLDRPARTLSGGEAHRVRLTAAFGSKFVNMLYVLDEPTTGLHPRDTERLLTAIQRLRDVGNTVVVVEHDAIVIRHADQVIDIGPGAGGEGGRIVFQGTPQALAENGASATADFICGRRHVAAAGSARRRPTGWLQMAGVEHHNLHDVTVDFPLGVLCVVTGVSGSGKSSLVEETLHPAIVAALRARIGKGDRLRAEDRQSTEDSDTTRCRPPFSAATGAYASLAGLDQIDNIVRIDQSPIGRSTRANPVSFLNLFGEIRTLFAETAEAKVKNFSARHFSFNSAGGGRCEACRGTGTIAVDMQFLPDVVTTCPDCHGARYRREVLEARYRGLSIAEVLALTIRDAFTFFRGRTRLQRRLKVLKDVGLEYIRLGQPAGTFSGGESQRLKLAAFLSRASRSRTLFLVDEPTAGLHPADIARLVDCLGRILAGGHSLIVIEHNLDFLRCADYLIDLGPGAGPAGGRIVATGTPEEIPRVSESVTGRFLEDSSGPRPRN